MKLPRNKFLKKYKWWILGVAGLLAVIPIDPTDVLDAGTPIIEVAIALVSLVGGRE